MKKTFEEIDGYDVRTKISKVSTDFTEKNILDALEELDKMQEQIIKTKEILNKAVQDIQKQKAKHKMENTNIPELDEDTRLKL